MRPHDRRDGGAERLLGPAYWDDGDPYNVRTAIVRMMAAPEIGFGHLYTHPHQIFDCKLDYPGQQIGRLVLGGDLRTRRHNGKVRRVDAVLSPLTIDRGDRWRVGGGVAHAHGERAIIDGKHAICVDEVSADITIAAQLMLWPRAWWWLLIRDTRSTRLLQRAVAGGAWRDRPDVLAAAEWLRPVPRIVLHVEL
ncbi:MAG: hypothetical protein ACOY45_02755 [Pseudomonadota bacterium]